MKMQKHLRLPIILALVTIVGATAAFALGLVPDEADSTVPESYVVAHPNELNNQEFGPNDVDSPLGELVSVNRGDEGKFTAEEWDDIIQKAENGDILLFDTLEDERAYFLN